MVFLSSIPVSGYLARPAYCLSLVSFLFFSCLVFLFGSFFLFCALTSGPPGVCPVTASSSAGHPASLSSAVAIASSTSFGFSPLASVFWGCSPLGRVSLGSGSAGAARLYSFYLFNLYSMMAPSLTAGSEYPSRGVCVCVCVCVLALRRLITS